MATQSGQTAGPKAAPNPAVVAGAVASQAAQAPAKPAKPATAVEVVKMKDGRAVEFAGKRKMIKESIIEASLIKANPDGSVTILPGAISTRIDLRSGDVFLTKMPTKMIPNFAGHGGLQKYGDELAAPADKQPSYADMLVWLGDLDENIQAGKWAQEGEGGGGVAGASIVIRAIMEASGKAQEAIKAFLNGKLEAAKAKGEKLSRKELYDSFRKAGTKTGTIIARMEREELEKNVKVDADAALKELG